MKLIIEQDDVKREIHAPFSMCMGRQDMKDLIYRLQQTLGPDDPVDDEPKHTYGWFEVWPHLPMGTPNTKPRKWAE